jgi:hypothetical protein
MSMFSDLPQRLGIVINETFYFDLITSLMNKLVSIMVELFNTVDRNSPPNYGLVGSYLLFPFLAWHLFIMLAKRRTTFLNRNILLFSYLGSKILLYREPNFKFRQSI